MSSQKNILPKRKVVLIGPSWPYRGGISDFTHRLANTFMEFDWDVRLETFTLQYPNLLFPGKSQFTDSPQPDNITTVRSVNSINPFNWVKVGLRIRKEAPDLVIFRFWIPFMAPCTGTIGRLIKGNGKSKVVSICDNIIPHEKRPGDTFLTKYFMKGCDAFVAMSKQVLSDMKTFDKEKPKCYSPHPIYDHFGELMDREKALKQLGLSPDFRYVLFFGFIRDYKGLDLLLKAMGDAQLGDLPVKLIVAGEYYTNSQPYLDLIDEQGIKERVILRTEFIPSEDVAAYFSVADIVAQPYKSATQSGVTQIGYHFEKPMLVTNVGGLPEIIPHGKVGYVVERDPKSIADSLRDFFENNRKGVFEQNLIEEKKKYDWHTFYNAIVSMVS